MDVAHHRFERLLVRVIQGDIQTAIARGEQPLPIPPLSPVRGEDTDQGAGASDPHRAGPSEHEVYTSDTTSTDDDDFQPFALPDVVEPADGHPVGDLPLAAIPAPVPLAAYPVVDMPLDVVSDDDVDLFEEDPPKADQEGGAPIDADVILPIADAPAEEASVHSPIPDSFESVASASLHTQGEQHHSHDADPDMASSVAPTLAHDFEFDHDDIEFIHLDQPLEEPVAPIDPLFDDPADFDMEFVDPEPVVAPEPVIAPDPALEHDPAHDDAPFVADHPVAAPLLVDDHVADAPVDAPLLMEDPEIPPPRPGEGSSRQPPIPVPPMLLSPFPFASQIPSVAPPSAPSFVGSSMISLRSQYKLESAKNVAETHFNMIRRYTVQKGVENRQIFTLITLLSLDNNCQKVSSSTYNPGQRYK
ncbi:fibrous sheath CABYR-binding protein-like [Helianthus annuus]|uniref:fibrous sheath CABYR-binding protein-like n=1 Tax=Helianthus annuus TaxID=4232 RepID=UPI000B907205|nr:fibrous sheath CABYR-binding protein-like [Helianthus annuus]